MRIPRIYCTFSNAGWFCIGSDLHYIYNLILPYLYCINQDCIWTVEFSYKQLSFFFFYSVFMLSNIIPISCWSLSSWDKGLIIQINSEQYCSELRFKNGQQDEVLINTVFTFKASPIFNRSKSHTFSRNISLVMVLPSSFINNLINNKYNLADNITVTTHWTLT